MDIQLFSDLHLDDGWPYNPPLTGDVIVFAGDIREDGKALDWLLSLKTSKAILFVPGNHEFYSRTKRPIKDLRAEFQHQARGTHVHVLDQSSVEIDGVRFHGLTLWTDYRLYPDAEAAKSLCANSVADYFHIYVDDGDLERPLTPEDTAEFHQGSIHWLQDSLATSKSRLNVVISHHAPSARSIANLDDPRSAAYASNLEGLIERYAPELWLHGHTHRSLDYDIGSTRIVCNARGHSYDAFLMNRSYSNEKLINL